jgi:DNA-binding NarL/FixJ family response regulator
MNNCLIVEDSAECLRWLAQIVRSTFPDCCVEYAADLRSALAVAGQGSYDLALIDLGLPDGCGLEMLRHLHRSAPDTVSVVVTVNGDDAQIVAALSAGAQGYLLKEHSAALLSRQLSGLSEGVPALSPSIARRIMEHFERTGPMEAADGALTLRERQILSLIARGLRNGEVARQLGISATTVASHIKSIYRKLGISSRAEASWYATRMGL